MVSRDHGLGDCRRVQSTDEFSPYCVPRETPTPDAFAISADGGASLMTGPDFGCVHHTEKP
jgi:hypothetical protein